MSADRTMRQAGLSHCNVTAADQPRSKQEIPE
jgi:hypothetical protein